MRNRRTRAWLMILSWIGLAWIAPARADITLMSQTAQAEVSANGESMLDALPADSPGVLNFELGTLGVTEYAMATLTSEFSLRLVDLSVSVDIGGAGTEASASASITHSFSIVTPTGFQVQRRTATASGGGFLGFLTYVRLSDAQGIIWESAAGLAEPCNYLHPDWMTLCLGPTLTPGTYTLELQASAYYPPDCGSCQGYGISGLAEVRMTFEPDVDGDGFFDVIDNCPWDVNPQQRDFDGDFEGDVCDVDDGLILVRDRGKTGGIEWQVESGYDSWNVYTGDLAVLRSTGEYTQVPGSNPLARQTCDRSSSWIDYNHAPESGQIVFYLVTGNAAGVESGLGDGTPVFRPNTFACH